MWSIKIAKISGFSKDSSFPPSMLVHKTHKTHRFSTHKFMLCDLSVGCGISFSKGCLWLPYISNCGHVRQWRKKMRKKSQSSAVENIISFKKPVWYYSSGTKSISHQFTLAWWKMGARSKVGTLWNFSSQRLEPIWRNLTSLSDGVACPFYIKWSLALRP